MVIAKDSKALSAWAGSTGKDPAYITALAGDDIDVYTCECVAAVTLLCAAVRRAETSSATLLANFTATIHDPQIWWTTAT